MQETHSKQSFENFKKQFETLSTYEQAGYFLWPSVSGYELTETEKELFKLMKPSGVVLFKRNFKDAEQSKKLISEIKDLCEGKNSHLKKPFIVSVDEEGGRVSRLPFEKKTSPVLSFVKNQDKEGLKNQTLLQTQLSKKLGINCILAPVLDIFTEPENTVIGDRSFGESPEEVCEYAEVVFNTLESEKIFSCGKHFPGHGNTKTDSHLGSAISDVDLETLKTREWLPFQYFIQRHIPMIMAAHVILPSIHPEKPTTLNSEVLTAMLRNEMNFEGLILSDDLRMGAIKKYYEANGIHDNYLAFAGIDALVAGCDILLSCHSIEDEKIIADALLKEFEQNPIFFNVCCKKAFRQTDILNHHFGA